MVFFGKAFTPYAPPGATESWAWRAAIKEMDGRNGRNQLCPGSGFFIYSVLLRFPIAKGDFHLPKVISDCQG